LRDLIAERFRRLVTYFRCSAPYKCTYLLIYLLTY